MFLLERFLGLLTLLYMVCLEVETNPIMFSSLKEQSANGADYVSMDSKHKTNIGLSKHLVIGSRSQWIPGLNFTEFHQKISKAIEMSRVKPVFSSKPHVSGQTYSQILSAKFHISYYHPILEKINCTEDCHLDLNTDLIVSRTSYLFNDITSKRNLLPASLRPYIPLTPNMSCVPNRIQVSPLTDRAKMRILSLRVSVDHYRYDSNGPKPKHYKLKLPLQAPGGCLDAIADVI